MTAQEFCYWLQGFLEVSGAKDVKPEQLKVVKDHLALVFTKVTAEPKTDAAKKLERLIRDLPRGDRKLC